MLFKKRHMRILLIIFIFLIGVYLFWLVRKGLYPFFIAVVFAYLLNPAVVFFEEKGLSRLWAIIIVYVLCFLLFLVLIIQLIPPVLNELEVLAKEMPTLSARIQEMATVFNWYYSNTHLPYSLRLAVDKELFEFERQIQYFITSLVSGIINLLSYSIGIVISPVLTFYLLYDLHDIRRNFIMLWPYQWRHEVILLLDDIEKVLNGVIRGQLIVAMIVGILISTGLSLLKVPFALLIGILAGTLDIIPYFGAIIGAMPAILIALTHSVWLCVKVALLFFAVHQLEGTIIGPKILGDNVGLHPLSVIMFLFIGEEAGGIIGMLLGVPIAALIKVVLRHVVNMLV